MGVFIGGVLFGAAIAGLIFWIYMTYELVVGALRIDTSDPEDGPYMFLELHRGIDQVYRRKYVVLKVNTKNYISHE